MASKPAFISHSAEREAQIQSRILDALEGRFRRRIAAAIVAESEEILSGYRELGYVPIPSDQAVRRFRDIYLDLAEASARTFGSRIRSQVKAKGHELETKEDGALAQFFKALAVAWINQEPIRRRIQSVSETTRTQIVNLILRGQADGLGVEAIARDVEGRLSSISRQRARIIARTETHGAANFAAHETAKSAGFELVKEWVSVEDHRTRDFVDAAGEGVAEFDHRAMNGQRRPMDEPFDMPWSKGDPLKIMYPGAANMPGGAVINCRCAVVHSIDD